MNESVLQFYDQLADEYQLMFADWRGEVLAEGRTLDAMIRRLAGSGAQTVLDCACGIGTQAIGLAARGYQVRATDLSTGALERAAREARNSRRHCMRRASPTSGGTCPRRAGSISRWYRP